MTHRPFLFVSIAALTGMALLTSGCVGLAVGAGATGAVAASQERGLGGTASDTQIRAAINYMWLDYSPEMYRLLNLAIYEGRVLVTGVVPKEEWRAEAIKRAWRASGVREVIDEIIVDPSGESGTWARDSWIATQLKTELLFDKNVYSVNYSIDVVRGVVYLLGVAQDREELDKVLNHARNIEYVQRVVNHVLLKDDPRRANDGQAPSQGTPSSAPDAPVSSSPADGSTSDTAPPAGQWPGESPRPTPRSGSVQTVPLDSPGGTGSGRF